MAEARALPQPLSGMADRLTNLHIRIEDFEVNVPATPAAGGTARPTTYKVGLSGSWPEAPIDLIPGVLQVKGVYLRITSDAAPAPTPTPGT